MEWRALPIDPRYKVSDTGLIKGLNGKLMKQATDTRGYKFVTLNNNYKQYHLSMHRAVAMCFIPNPDNLPQINHIDEDKANNNKSNLEWCDNRYNSHYSHSARVLMIDKKTLEIVKEFESIRDVDLFFGKEAHQSVGKVCHHMPRYYSAYGYFWEFKNNIGRSKMGRIAGTSVNSRQSAAELGGQKLQEGSETNP